MTDETKVVEKKEKVVKPKGPIRTGAVIPFIVMTVLVVLFNIFLLDSTIKKTIEFAGEQINGAEVNISKVDTNFKELKIKVSKIEFTDKENPEFNKLEIGSLDFQLLWDALLRGKIVINLANLNDILLNTKRSYKGRILPVEIDEKSGNRKATQAMLNKAKKEFDGNVFGDIAGVLAGGSTGDVAGNIQGTLKSKKKFDELNVLLKTKEKTLSTDLKNLPSKKELNNLQKRLGKIRWKDLGNILKAPKVLQEADKLNRDINKAVKSYDTASKNFNKSLAEIDKSYKEAQALVGEDINSVSNRMNLPKLDQKSIAKMLFGNEILGTVQEAKKYQTMAEKYMPPNKVKKQKPSKTPRGKGRNYKFGTPNSYPMFWLKLAKIESKNDQGSVLGKIENVTNDQVATGKLTSAQFKADFPPQSVRNISAKIIIDHRDKPSAKVNATIGSFLVTDKALSETADATFIIKKSTADSVISGVLTPDSANISIKNKFKKIKYITKAKSPAVKEVLADVAKNTKVLTLNAKVKGKWDKLAFDIKSNLAKAIQTSVRSLIKAKIEKVRRKIKEDIEKQIASSRGAVDKQINGIKSKVNKQLASGKKQMNKFKSQLKNEEKKAKKKAKKSFKNPFKKFKL